MPDSGPAVATSDQRVSLWRSSNGKSNRVASIWVVSSIDTRSTQSNVSPVGSESRILQTRWRMMPCMSARFLGATTGCTTLRCWSCFGRSMAMNMGILKSSA